MNINYKKITWYECVSAYGLQEGVVSHLQTIRLPLFMFHLFRHLGFFLDKLAEMPRKIIDLFTIEHIDLEKFPCKKETNDYYLSLIKQWKRWRYKVKNEN